MARPGTKYPRWLGGLGSGGPFWACGAIPVFGFSTTIALALPFPHLAQRTGFGEIACGISSLQTLSKFGPGRELTSLILKISWRARVSQSRDAGDCVLQRLPLRESKRDRCEHVAIEDLESRASDAVAADAIANAADATPSLAP